VSKAREPLESFAPAPDGERSVPVESAGEIAGSLGAQAATRSGHDERRRGWFWHWNAIVTQYAPLIGLKGVGLLNSYTVWTDRREESPHRGYAFPSQQSEADFYGEDRAELITINKILVALDLIEIRKEMVLRADEQGRRWRVPHNFYRVKDRDDGFTLDDESVLKVVRLAEKDRAIYRYIRHIFSARFRPIDPHNVWSNMLVTLRRDETWRKLAARAADDERRASARTLAGHASRKTRPAHASHLRPLSDSPTVVTDPSPQTFVASTNRGLRTGVGEANKGSRPKTNTLVAPVNVGGPTDVAPANTTYNQRKTTTTTQENSSAQTDDTLGRGPGHQIAPTDRPNEERALRRFEEANGRPATAAERKILKELAERFEPAARECPVAEWQSGWAWVAAAIYEAVDAGSAYVAPKRVREILARWERDGIPTREQTNAETPSRRTRRAAIALGESRNVPFPNGMNPALVWERVAAEIGKLLGESGATALLGGTAIVGFHDGEVTVAVKSRSQATRLAGEYNSLASRKLSDVLRQPVRLAVLSPDNETVPEVISPPRELVQRTERTPLFPVGQGGLSNIQVWAAVLEELRKSESISRANFETWLRPTLLLAVRDSVLIVGAPNNLAARRIADRHRPALSQAIESILGSKFQVEVVVTDDWLDTAEPTSPAASQSGTDLEETGA
jgi:DnaA N-terminal domain